MDPSGKRKETGRLLISFFYLNRLCVLDRGVKVEVLGIFCLSISHQVIGNAVQGTVGQAD